MCNFIDINVSDGSNSFFSELTTRTLIFLELKLSKKKKNQLLFC